MNLARAACGGPGSPGAIGDRRLEVEPFERLLMPASGATRQLEPDGCGAACLEMALALEHGTAGRVPGIDQASLAARCRAAATADGERPHPMRWAASPASLQHVLNAHPSAGEATDHRRQHYHIVHAAAPRGPLEEILSWLRGPRTASGHLALPSFLLTRHGTHWMLVVGARVHDKGLVWLAAADPASGRLLGLTPAGVQAEFTPNLVGTHPDWSGRHVAVIPSVLPRRWHAAPGASEGEAAAAATVASSLGGGDPTESAGVDFTADARSDAEAAPVLTRLAEFAAQARDPRAVRWLAPLREARHLVDPDHPAGRRGSAAPDGPRRAWVVDAARRPVAEVALRGDPATVLQFSLLQSVDRGPSPSGT